MARWLYIENQSFYRFNSFHLIDIHGLCGCFTGIKSQTTLFIKNTQINVVIVMGMRDKVTTKMNSRAIVFYPPLVGLFKSKKWLSVDTVDEFKVFASKFQY